MILQTWDPKRYAHHTRFVSDLGEDVLQLLDPKPREAILDLGCGDGALTEKLVALAGSVIGVDSSPEMVEAARERGLDARVMDGESLTFETAFDAVFSNAAMHWMKTPDRVIAGVWRALRPGGRFVAELGGGDNVAAVVEALSKALARRGVDVAALNPWYFPYPEEYTARLETGGFSVTWMALIPRPTPIPGDIVAWLETMAGSFTGVVPAAERSGFLAEVREALQPKLCRRGEWHVDYVRLRFAAHKPA